MGKSDRAATAARAAELRAEAARKDRQRKQVIAASVAVVVIIIAVVLGAVIANRPQAAAPTASGGAAALAKLTTLPAATLDASAAPNTTQAPVKLEGATPLTQDGKPKVLYIGAEYCPFCAMERWALIGALARFGTFTGVTETTSASDDIHPNTPTFSFHGSTYKSDHVAFEAVETQDRLKQPLETLDGANLALFQKFNPSGGIPWITYGGTFATAGATVDANAFEGKTYDQIIAGILDPESEIGKTVNPAINMITAQICQETKGQPANVCTSQGVLSASVLLKK